ncbi:hypothetical protein [Kordia sp.]|uniref:hypothetical protein n=1 Tax=Kordia sp. TaxID=1965332 RepID=UPI003D2A2BB5
MQNRWTFPNSTDNSLILVKNKTIYISTEKEDDVAQQLKSIEADQLPKDLNEIHFATIEQVIFHKNKIEIHQKNTKKTLFIDNDEKINAVFNTLKKENPTLKYIIKRPSIMNHIKIHLLITILLFARLMYYLLKINDIGQSATSTYLQEYYGVTYGNFIHGFASFGFVGIFVIGLIYILIALFLLNYIAEKRPFTKILKRI